ncbi:MAG: hypothetical protein VKQ33_15315 [Candidatus Sericytochromatia bacterium]|nr:hypothetical protein [Candidatus Sericytochromatia bacterium]
MWLALASFLGAGATILALLSRWAQVRRLDRGYLPRFLLVQGLAINAALLGVGTWTVAQFGVLERLGPALLTGAYGGLFFFYSLSNIDWTIKKFHDEPR